MNDENFIVSIIAAPTLAELVQAELAIKLNQN